jgi:hypothetical protein
MTPASTATAAATTTAFAINAIAPRFDPVAATLVTRAALGSIVRRKAALFAAITGTTTILEPAHAESGLTFIRRTLGLVTRRQRLALRSACRTILARPAIAASAATTPATPLAPFSAGPRFDALARLDRRHDRLVTTLLARCLTRRASSWCVRRALAPVTTSRGPLGTRRTSATTFASASNRSGSSITVASAIPAAALTTTASAIPATATTAPLGPSAAITANTAWLLGFLFADRAARTRRHAHAERTGTETEEARRSFLHHGDHCLGARQAQRRQSFVHGLLERSAFEDVAPGFRHAFLVWGAPGSPRVTGARSANHDGTAGCGAGVRAAANLPPVGPEA